MPRQHSYIHLNRRELAELNSFMEAMLRQRPRKFKARRRAQAIWWSHQGWTVQKISRHYGLAESTVWLWLSRYRQQGVAGLLSKPWRRPQRLNPRRIKELFKVWRKSPATVGLKARPWTYPLLARWVKKKWGIRLSDKRLGQIIRHDQSRVNPVRKSDPPDRRAGNKGEPR